MTIHVNVAAKPNPIIPLSTAPENVLLVRRDGCQGGYCIRVGARVITIYPDTIEHTGGKANTINIYPISGFWIDEPVRITDPRTTLTFTGGAD